MKIRIFFAVFLLLAALPAFAADVAVWGEALSGFSLSTVNNFYDGLDGHTSTILTGSLDSNDLSPYELLWATQPADDYTDAEIGAMSSYLSGGGRIAFMGEHGSFGTAQNARIGAAIAALGGHITINTDSPDSGFHDATRTNGQILNHSLTQGVDVYNYACFASLNLSGDAEALMYGTNPALIMMAYENIGAGSIFLITDQNVWDNVNLSSNDNARMFENLLLAETNAPPPTTTTVPEPGILAMLAISLVGLVGLRKRFVK